MGTVILIFIILLIIIRCFYLWLLKNKTKYLPIGIAFFIIEIICIFLFYVVIPGKIVPQVSIIKQTYKVQNYIETGYIPSFQFIEKLYVEENKDTDDALLEEEIINYEYSKVEKFMFFMKDTTDVKFTLKIPYSNKENTEPMDIFPV